MSSFEPPKRILVPWDFSDLSHRALAWATGVRAALGGQIVLLHVGPSTTAFLSPFPDLAGFQMDAWKEARGKREEQVMARLEEVLGAAELLAGLELHYVEAEPVAAIVEAVAEEGIELVVLGSHGRDGIARTVLGSVSELVARRVDVPVVLVP